MSDDLKADLIEQAARVLAENAYRRYAQEYNADHLSPDDFMADARDDIRDLERAQEKAVEELADQAQMKGMTVENGTVALDVVPPHEIALLWVNAARGMLGDAENYTETRIDFPKTQMEVKLAGEVERFVFTLQRAGKVTPHEARVAAEAERDALQARIDAALALTEDPEPHVCETSWGQYIQSVRAVLLGDSTPEVHTTEPKKHSHDTSCCWNCFHGPDAHPDEPGEDVACESYRCSPELAGTAATSTEENP